MSRFPIQIIQGAQYGSEAKGAIAAYLCKRDDINIAVRTGATNAGHTVIYNGVAVKMQQLPVGWVNPNTTLVLGAGALIDPAILEREVKMVSDLTGHDVRERLLIDSRAGVHNASHAERSKESGRHHGIGATGKGCSEALIDKIRLRGAGYRIFGDTEHASGYKLGYTDEVLNDAFDHGARIQLEGTQGTLLDLNLGPYPYVTHKPTGPGQWMVECGLSPNLPVDIVFVVRTYPIRVAGNSGPLPNETSWPILARDINTKRDDCGLPPIVGEWAIENFENAVRHIGRKEFSDEIPRGRTPLDMHKWTDAERANCKRTVSELHKAALESLSQDTVDELCKLFEMTTVTKKLRRVAKLSLYDLERSTDLCRPTQVALTFVNYLEPQYWYKRSDRPEKYDWISMACNAPITMQSYGPNSDETHIAS